MSDIIEFPSQRNIHSFDMREIKRLTPQLALKSCLNQLPSDTQDYLKSVIFGKWPLLREGSENAAFMFTSCFPLDSKRSLVATAMQAAADAYKNCQLRGNLDRPVAYFETLNKALDRHTLWQPIGASTDNRRHQGWGGTSQPLPVWLRRNDLFNLEFVENDMEHEESPSSWLILASKLLPEGGETLMKRIIEEQYQQKEANVDE
ncbi:hypothetical protein QU487_06955 [Crenobacter sp. SG2305]|uniref:hypothetical protein n=1 Tax=Crenobacter oryzisoli TaxID=3056844 RepID=UPI0025AB1563|nr:hypothetical protein [Crenobacter sp. SG2305]MDN0082494.1 hypothetical protein [Crenobacter sp. SG2305]